MFEPERRADPVTLHDGLILEGVTAGYGSAAVVHDLVTDAKVPITDRQKAEAVDYFS